MKFKISTMALALAMVVGGAHAGTNPSSAATAGNSSVLFVAVDINSNAGLVVDLGLNMSDFTNSTTMTGAGTTATWNFGTNVASMASITGNAWSAAYNTFVAAQSGGDFRWGVVAGDSIVGTAVTATNAIIGRGVLATGNPTVAEMLTASSSGPTGSALGNFSNFLAAANNLGNLGSAAVNNGAGFTDSGANSGTGGAAWLPQLMMNPLGTAGQFNGQLTWDYLMTNGQVSNFNWHQQIVANPVINQLGAPSATDALSSNPGTFVFDIASNTLTWAVAPIPEPGTYAMFMAGLAMVGFVARRRKV
jgi:PEP-CTERM motif